MLLYATSADANIIWSVGIKLKGAKQIQWKGVVRCFKHKNICLQPLILRYKLWILFKTFSLNFTLAYFLTFFYFYICFEKGEENKRIMEEKCRKYAKSKIIEKSEKYKKVIEIKKKYQR